MTTIRRALILVDVQNQYFDGPLAIQYPPRDMSVQNIVRLIDHAKEQGIPVVAVQHTYPADAPVFAEGSRSWELHPDVASRATPSWKRVRKIHGSVFAGTDLIMTDAGVLADSADASFGGQVWRIPLGVAGLATWTGTIG